MSTSATSFAIEAYEMLGIRSEIGNTGIDHAARTRGQLGKAGTTALFVRSFEDEPQPLLDQVPELAAAQRRGIFGTVGVATTERHLHALRAS